MPHGLQLETPITMQTALCDCRNERAPRGLAARVEYHFPSYVALVVKHGILMPLLSFCAFALLF